MTEPDALLVQLRPLVFKARLAAAGGAARTAERHRDELVGLLLAVVRRDAGALARRFRVDAHDVESGWSVRCLRYADGMIAGTSEIPASMVALMRRFGRFEAIEAVRAQSVRNRRIVGAFTPDGAFVPVGPDSASARTVASATALPSFEDASVQRLQLRAATATLSAADRLLVFAPVVGMPTDELAALNATTPGTVHVRQHRARARARVAWAQHGLVHEAG